MKGMVSKKVLTDVRFWCFLLLLLTLSLVELVLIEVKYYTFLGGFHQSNQLTTYREVSWFIFTILLNNFVILSILFLIWNKALRRFNMQSNFIMLHFALVVGIAFSVVLTLDYQLHKYFKDAMDMALVQEIAGGSLKTAVMYVMDEIILLSIGFVILFLGYLLVFKICQKPFKKNHNDDFVFSKIFSRSSKAYAFILVILLFIAGNQYILNNDDNLRVNSRKAIGYSIVNSSLVKLTDFDRDGYGLYSYPQDIDLLNSQIYPGALDYLDNGVDENLLMGDFINFKAQQTYMPSKDYIVAQKHLVFIVMESARGDIVDKSIDGKLVAPNITRLAHEGSYIPQAYSHTGYTSSSLSALFSGQLVDFPLEYSLHSKLKELGYQASIYSGQDETWGNLDEKLGTRIDAHFFYDAQVGVDERVFASKLPSSIKLSEETLWQQFDVQSKKMNWNDPQFIYFNMQAGHFPYSHKKMDYVFVESGIPRSQIVPENAEWIKNTYWNAMHHADQYIGKIADRIKELGIWEETLIVIVGDHGEELFDEGHLGHGFYLNEKQTNIPLVFSQPHLEIPVPVGLIDIPTIALANVVERKVDFTQLLMQQSKTKDKSIFQYIGSLAKPNKISLRTSGYKQIQLDLVNMLVQTEKNDKWAPYALSMADPQIKDRLEELVNHWENLRWQQHLAQKITNKKEIKGD